MGKFTSEDRSDTKWIRAFLGMLEVRAQRSVVECKGRALLPGARITELMALVPGL